MYYFIYRCHIPFYSGFPSFTQKSMLCQRRKVMTEAEEGEIWTAESSSLKKLAYITHSHIFQTSAAGGHLHHVASALPRGGQQHSWSSLTVPQPWAPRDTGQGFRWSVPIRGNEASRRQVKQQEVFALTRPQVRVGPGLLVKENKQLRVLTKPCFCTTPAAPAGWINIRHGVPHWWVESGFLTGSNSAGKNNQKKTRESTCL